MSSSSINFVFEAVMADGRGGEGGKGGERVNSARVQLVKIKK